MQEPKMLEARQVADDTYTLGAWMPVPGFGVLAVNSFLIKSAEPALIDTGLRSLTDEFMRELQNAIDPSDLRWIWITHSDADHLGSLARILELAPHARVVTTYLGMAKLALNGLPVDRAYLLNPGQSLDVGDRKLAAYAPPVFDAPETTAVFDSRSRILFSADSFGALLPEVAEAGDSISADVLRQGMHAWAAVDAPWLKLVDPQLFAGGIRKFRDLQPEQILSSHLPAASRGILSDLFENLASAPEAPAFVGPDQAALEQMMAAA